MPENGDKAPFADIVALAEPAVEVETLAGGGWLLRCPHPLDPYPDHLVVCLRQWAEQAPERDFLCQRAADGGWRRVTYGAAARLSAGIAQALIDRGHGPERPVAILSDNSIDFALLMLGALHVSVPVMPVSTAYSLMSSDHAKLKAVVAHHRPGIVFVDDPAPYAKALAALEPSRIAVLASTEGAGAEGLDQWMRTEPTPEVEARLAQVGPDTVAKILLTSGSTGQPKGVLNTQRMMCANQAMKNQMWPFLRTRPPVLVDWLPWNHTFGGNYCFNLILTKGGTFYIDEGKPAPGRFEQTLANLREVSPTIYLNVPRGYDLLVPELEADDELRATLFRDLDILFFAGAALPQDLHDRLAAMSVAERGRRLPIVTSLGATETGPAATYMTWESEVAGNIGLPLPGCEMKMAPVDGKYEARFRGPHVTPGYFGEPGLTAECFDDDGFFRIGDAVRWLDRDDPLKGVVFDGRVAENFKLDTGTWVASGTLRLAAISAAAPAIQDAVVTGHDRGEVGLLVFPNLAGCRGLCPEAGADEPAEALLARPQIHAHLRRRLASYNRANPASSTRIARLLLMTEPPAIDAGEITDKGYINQGAVLDRRAALVERLYATDDAPDIVTIASES